MFKRLKEFPVASPQASAVRSAAMGSEVVESFMGARRSNMSLPRSIEDIAGDSVQLTIGALKTKIGVDTFYGIRGEVMKDYKAAHPEQSSYSIEKAFDDEAMYDIIGELLNETSD